MSLKKLSITDEQIKKVRELVSQNVPIYLVAKKMSVSKAKLWRNVPLIEGLTYKYKKKPKLKEDPHTDLFNCNEFLKAYKY